MKREHTEEQRKRINDGARARQAKQKAAHSALGLCVRCHNEAVAGKTLCLDHAKQWSDYLKRNRDKVRDYRATILGKEMLRQHGLKYRQRRNETRRRKRKEDPRFSLVENIRRRINKAITSFGNGHKSTRSVDLLGCSFDYLMEHLESLFIPGMSWENRKLWHVDHIRPCARFDLADPEQQKACFHYTNLQPLWAPDNMKKGDKWDEDRTGTTGVVFGSASTDGKGD